MAIKLNKSFVLPRGDDENDEGLDDIEDFKKNGRWKNNVYVYIVSNKIEKDSNEFFFKL